MTDSTQILVDRIEAAGGVVKKAGQGWIAQCPAHDDGRPSLSINRGRGQALTYCFAGCTADQIAESVGLRIDDLFDDPKGISYEYRSHGRVARTVYRSPSKQFTQSVVDKTVVPLYVPDGVDLAATVARGNDVYVTEGEKDADRLADEGVAAITSPMGALSWAKADWNVLAGASDIWVVADNDEPGMERARGLSAHLSTITTGAVTVLRAAVGKDATDHLVAGKKFYEFVPVDLPIERDDAFENAVDQERMFLRVKTEARARDQREKSETVGGKLDPKSLGEILGLEYEYDWIVPYLLERQDRLILTGNEGSGKSHLLRQIAITMSAGVHPFMEPIDVDPMKVLVVDAENTERQWARSAQYVTDLSERRGIGNPRSDVTVSAGVRLDLTLPADVNQIHKLIDQHNPDVLYIGPLYKLVPKEISTDDDAAPLIVALDSFRERGLTLLMEAHAGHTKGTGGSRDMRPRGSSALLGWPEFGMGLSPLGDDDSMVSVTRWRGDRERRNWPTRLRRGIAGEMPWVTVNE